MHEDTADIGRSAMSKAMWRIVPLIGLAYLCAYTDRVNVSFAASQMNADLGFSATIYGLGAGLFFLGYALFEVPSSLMCVRYSPRKWLARIMITWGLLSAGTMFVSTPLEFYIVRFLLGIAEAGFYPGVIYYFSMWFPPCHRSRAVSRFYIAGPLTSVVLGAISASLLGLEGQAGLKGWQWLFLVQGLPSVVVGLMLLKFLPDTPDKVVWLNNREKVWIAGELAREQGRIEDPAHHGILSALRNPRVLHLGMIGLFYIGSITTLILSAPLVLTDATGLSIREVGWIISIGGILGVGVILWSGSLADRRSARFPDAYRFAVVIALSLLALALSTSPVVSIAAYLLFAATCFTIGPITSSGWPEVLTTRELAVGAAAINTLSQIGAFATPFAWGALKDATGDFRVGLFLLFAISAGTAALLYTFCRRIRPLAPAPLAGASP